jgi:hypothetical protein
MTTRTKQLIITYSLLLLIPGLVPICVLIFCRPHYVSLDTGICSGVISLFGPWSPLVAKLTSIPNAGEFFYPWLAMGLSLGLLTVILSSVLIVKRWVTALCIGLFIPPILLWLFFGLGHMATCLS